MSRLLNHNEKQSFSNISATYCRHDVAIKHSVQMVLLDLDNIHSKESTEIIVIRQDDLPEDIWRALRSMASFDVVKKIDDDAITVEYSVVEALINLLLQVLEAMLREDREYFARASNKPTRHAVEGNDLVLWTPHR